MLRYDLEQRPGSWATVVLAHPHPDMGGDRFHPIIDALFRALPLSTIRFDFSSSSLPTAEGELRQAIALSPEARVVLAGYSFGANIALGVTDTPVLGWFLVAPPLRFADREPAAASDSRPKQILVPEHDQFSAPADVAAAARTWVATSTTLVPGSDHFLGDRSGFVLDAAVAWIADLGREARPG